MNAYLPDLFTVVIVQILALMSPGLDFDIVLKNSFLHSRRTGVLTALGVTSGISVHLLCTLARYWIFDCKLSVVTDSRQNFGQRLLY
jgi:threonine/homoserine/homoserine lactone efflux protein